MKPRIQIKLYATLQKRKPDGDPDCDMDRFEIDAGMTVEHLLAALDIAVSEAKLIFVNGKRASLTTTMKGGERVGIFPPVGGG